MDIRRLRRQLIEDEGIVYEIYYDTLGYKTFGVGHKVKPTDVEWSKPEGTKVSMQRVWDCFEEDVYSKIRDTEDLYKDSWDRLPCEVKEVLINMCFNLGKAGLASFRKMKRAIELGDWDKAAYEGRYSLWYRQVSHRAERLMKRMEQACTSKDT